MSDMHRANARLVDQGSASVSAELLSERLGRWAQGEGTLAECLARAILVLVQSGELRAGDRLPAERSLAATISVSRGTVVSAFGILAEGGVVERQQGSGTRVLGAALRSSSPAKRGSTDALFSALPSSIDLLRGVPQLPELAVRLVREHSFEADAAMLSETDPSGIPVLRERIARLFSDEGTPTMPEQILVTHGAQAALYLIVEELVSAGDVVLVEELTWPGLSDVVRRRGGVVVGVQAGDRSGVRAGERSGVRAEERAGERAGEQGLDMVALEQAIVRLRPALIAVNPHHQNPTGSRLSDAARLRLAELSAEYGVPVLEDRVLAPIAFDGVVPPSLASLRPDAPIIVAESVSKWAWCGLRLGWVRADPVLIRRMRSRRQVTDMYTSVPAQLLALDFLDAAPALRREVSATHARRLELLRELLAEHLPEWSYTPPRGGLSLWAQLPEGSSAEALIGIAARHGVAVAGSGSFAASVVRDDCIRLPFTAPEDVLREGIRRLGEAWRELRASA